MSARTFDSPAAMTHESLFRPLVSHDEDRPVFLFLMIVMSSNIVQSLYDVLDWETDF